MTATAPSLEPVQSTERYSSLDLLRGFALFGVLTINLLYFFRTSLWDHMAHFHSHPGALNHAVDIFCTVLIEFKAFDLFALTFGIGMAIQFDRARARGANPEAFLIRRFLVLLLFGLTHLLLISNVDILTLYAVCALILTIMIRLPAPVLAVAGVALIYGPDIFSVDWQVQGWADAALQHYAHGNFTSILAFRWSETRALIFPLLVLTAQRTAALMLIGIAVWRSGLIRSPERYRKSLWTFCAVAGTIGLTNCLADAWSHITGGHLARPRFFGDLGSDIPLALAYGSCLLALRAAKTLGSAAAYFAAMGQMALTNYLTQSIVCSLIFYGFGLGLFGQIAPAPCLLFGIAFYTLQVALSRWWLRRYRFGPCEWLWRSLTYGKRQPMRRFATA